MTTTQVSVAVGNRRLLKLARFLRKLPDAKFDFSEWVTKGGSSCGTVCCAVGWMPKVEPEAWKWCRGDSGCVSWVELRNDSANFTDDDARTWFRLTYSQTQRLFMPDESGLGDDATPKASRRPHREFREVAPHPACCDEEVMTSAIAEFHTSEISDACPMHVKLRLEGKLIGDTPGALYRGQLFNDALSILYTRKAWDRPACESAVVAACKGVEAKSKVENRPFTPAVKDSLTTHNAEVLALVVQYAQRFAPRTDDKVIGVELPVRFTLEHPAMDEPAEFASHLDLLYRRGDGRLVCPDFKLRKDSPSPAFLARWPQGAIYWLAIRYGSVLVAGEWLEFGEWPIMQWIDATNLAPYGRAHTNPSTGESFKKGDVRPEGRIVLHAPFLPQGEQAARDMLAERVEMMRAGFFPAMPDPEACGFCDARGFCPSIAGGAINDD